MPSLRNWRKKRVTKSNDKKVPALRFKGFTDDWEQRKLGDVVKAKSGWSPSEFKIDRYQGILFIKVDDLNNSQREQDTSKWHVYENRNYPKIKKLSTIFPKRGAAILTNKVRILSQDCYMDTNIMALEPEKIEPDFLYSFIEQTGLFKIADTSTIPQINNKHINPYKLWIPYYSEQKKIANLLKIVDNIITLQQRKLEQLNLLNQAMLQQMFANKDIPKIRFKEFKSIWKHRKLDSLAEFSKGKGYSKKDLIPKGNPIILYGQLYTNYQTIIKKIDTFAKTNKESVISRGREVIIPASGETADDISRASVVNKAGIIIGGDLNIIRPYSIISPIFLAFTLSNGTQRKELSKYAQGKSVVHLHNADLKNVSVFLPTMKEQSKINSILSKLNELNLLSKNKLAILQEIKNALLQILFV